jgi:hypothetical protein
MTPLPKDIEEAIGLLEQLAVSCAHKVSGYSNEYLRAVSELEAQRKETYAKITEAIQFTQRQRYKEAAMQGLLGSDSRNTFDAETIVRWSVDFANKQLAEDAEHAKKEAAK